MTTARTNRMIQENMPLYVNMSPEQKATLLLECYFKGVDAEIDVVMVGKRPYVDIQYVDFKPVEEVKQQLQAIIKGVKWTRLERRFSKQAIMDELWQMYYEDKPMLVSEDDEVFHRTFLSVHVGNRLTEKRFAADTRRFAADITSV